MPGAAKWYERAARNGVHEAAFNLGFLLENGLAGEADSGAASNWYLQAAEAGLGPAQLNLGVLYAEGEGLDRDLIEAWVWFDLAASKDQPQAEIFRMRLDGMMSDAERERARTVARKRRKRLP